MPNVSHYRSPKVPPCPQGEQKKSWMDNASRQDNWKKKTRLRRNRLKYLEVRIKKRNSCTKVDLRILWMELGVMIGQSLIWNNGLKNFGLEDKKKKTKLA